MIVIVSQSSARQQFQYGPFQFGVLRGDNGRTDHQQAVIARFEGVKMMTHDLAYPSFGPIAHRRPADMTPGDEGKAANR